MSLDDFPLACEGVISITLVLLSLLLQSSQMSHCVGGSKAHPETSQFTGFEQLEFDPICGLRERH